MSRPDQLATRLREAFGAADSSARLQAALAAGTHPEAEQLAVLVDQSAVEPDFFARDMLSWELTRHPAETALPLVLAQLDRAEPQARSQALHTLSTIADPATWPAITADISTRTTTRSLGPPGAPPSSSCRPAGRRTWRRPCPRIRAGRARRPAESEPGARRPRAPRVDGHRRSHDARRRGGAHPLRGHLAPARGSRLGVRGRVVRGEAAHRARHVTVRTGTDRAALLVHAG